MFKYFNQLENKIEKDYIMINIFKDKRTCVLKNDLCFLYHRVGEVELQLIKYIFVK